MLHIRIFAYSGLLIANVGFMNRTHATLFARVRLFSRLTVAIAVFLSIIFTSSLGTDSLNWQILLAAAALAIGIPHGALDHLVTLKGRAPNKMAAFIITYIAIALISIWALLQWNVLGFIVVVLMSSLHFGVGDSAFIAELDRLENRSGPSIPILGYASAGGLLPVVIPLTNEKSNEALAEINQSLINWHYSLNAEIRSTVIIISVVSVISLIARRRYRDILDIALLAALAFFAPPLVAFSVYFGCWHAMRHTARLTSLLPKSLTAYESGSASGAFKAAVLPGLPALFGTAVFIYLLAFYSNQSMDNSLLWYALVTVWSLTVPHMIATARLDLAAFKVSYR